MKNSRLGFTLVELLVVIAIISVLSTVAVVNLRIAKAKARDAKRLSDVTQIAKAVEVFNSVHGRYPQSVSGGYPVLMCYNLAGLTSCNSINNPGQWIPELGMTLPDDPVNDSGGLDVTEYYSGSPLVYIYTHEVNRNPNFEEYFYILFQLEAQSPVDRCNGSPWPGWSCVGGGRLLPP